MGALDGLKALVTGGASGIGARIAEVFLTEGATVAVLDREPATGLPQQVVVVKADLSDDAGVRAAGEEAVTALGGLDVLVNNAGIGAQGTVETATDEDWARVLDVNVVGTARVTRAALPHLRRSPHAAVVNTCSAAATSGLPERAVYSASKGAILSLTRAMAADHLREG